MQRTPRDVIGQNTEQKPNSPPHKRSTQMNGLIARKGETEVVADRRYSLEMTSAKRSSSRLI